jgi:hypothetical protein
VRIVYDARQMPLGRPVELVGLSPGVLLTSPLARALLREAEVLAQLDHPNVQRLIDLRQDDSQLWLVLEQVDGPSLAELAKKELSLQAVAAIGLDLARALVHVHTAGETHGQLHLGAVQLTKSGRTKLSGFGRNLAPQSDQVEALQPRTEGGLSPEGSIGQAVGPLSDLFAWGALMYELLCEEPPFGDPNDTRYSSRVRNDRPTPLLLKRPDIPSSLEHIISRCLEKLPAERPAHAAEIAEILETVVGGSTVPILRAELLRLGYHVMGHEEGSPSLPLAQKSHLEAIPTLRHYALPALFGLCGALVAGTLVYTAMKAPAVRDEKVKVARDLLAEEALLLRVVASPWAHVIVDGKHRETTPFAEPIALPPGKHVVRLEHPHAATEERVVEGRAGQAVLLNVQMHVERPLNFDAPIEEPEETSP